MGDECLPRETSAKQVGEPEEVFGGGRNLDDSDQSIACCWEHMLSMMGGIPSQVTRKWLRLY
jgi:hypothetical protein